MMVADFMDQIREFEKLAVGKKCSEFVAERQKRFTAENAEDAEQVTNSQISAHSAFSAVQAFDLLFRSARTNSGKRGRIAEYLSHALWSTAGAPLTSAPAAMSLATPLCGVTMALSPTLQ